MPLSYRSRAIPAIGALLSTTVALPILGLVGAAQAFRLGTERYFEPDEGRSIAFSIDAAGDRILGRVASHNAAEAALAAWTTATGSPITLTAAGTTEDLERACPGPNKIIFNDPENLIPAPVPDPSHPGHCRGSVALGIQRGSTFEFKDVGGRSFARARCGFVVVADGWESCANWTPCNLEEAITHELGHVIGLEHSSESDLESDPRVREATMYFRAHFDGRCASLRDDDRDGLRAVYPSSLPPTIQTATPLPPATRLLPYALQLEAEGGAPPFQWSRGRTNVVGLEVSNEGRITGTPSNGGARFLQITATDARGMSHTKVLDLQIEEPLTLPPTAAPTASPTASPTATHGETASATPTKSATATPPATPTQPPACAGDCDRDDRVSVDEIVRAVSIALGVVPLGDCSPGDSDRDGRVTVDEILRAVSSALAGCGAH